MTTTIDKPQPDTSTPAEYPTLLRMGHVFETSVGHRSSIEGLHAPLDVAIGGDGWCYVIVKHVNNPQFPRARLVPVTLEDTYGPDILPTVNGKPDERGNEFFTSPICVASDGAGTLFMTDEHRNVVAMFSTGGETIGWWGESGDGPGELNAPSGIALAPDGTLWVVSTRSPRIQQFSRGGEHLRGFGEFGTEPGQLNYPWGVAVDPVNGTILVADWRNDRVQRFTPEGELLQVIDELGRGRGRLKRPSSVAVDLHGDMYVCDRGNDRVVQFNPRGLFVESVIGDAPMTERGANRLVTNPDMLRWRDHIVDLDREKRFVSPTSVKVDDQLRVYVVDTGRFRIQVYRKTFRLLGPGEVDPPDSYQDPKLN